MAFQTAAGYNNLPNGAFSPELYSKKVQLKYRKTAVAEDITSNNYFGEISNFGDSVRILKEPEIAISRYARGVQVTPQDLEDSDFTLVIDRANKFSFRLDDIEEAHSHVDWMAMAKDRAAYRLAEEFDADILGYMSGFERDQDTGLWSARTTAVGTKAEASADADELLGIHKLDAGDFGGTDSQSIHMGTSGTFDATPVEILSRMYRLLDEQYVPQEGRWVVIGPAFEEALRAEDSKFMNHDYQGSESLSNGRISSAKVRGFRIYRSNSLPFLGAGADSGETDEGAFIIAGHDAAVATASQISKTETLRDPNTFADVVRGLHLYGRKILRPEGLLRAFYRLTA